MPALANGTTRKPHVSKVDCERVRYLAATLDDWAKQVKTSTGMIVARGSAPGEVPSRLSPCPVCAGEGLRRVRGITRPCERCKASGKIRVDAYTGRERVAGDDSLAAHYEHQQRDDSTKGLLRMEERERNERTVARLEDAARIRAGIEGTGDAYTAACTAKERQFERGSYAELVQVLDRMRTHEYRRYRDFMRFCVGGLPLHSARLEQRAERLIVLVALRMPKPIRAPHGAVKRDDGIERHFDKTQKGERNAEIRRLHSEGWKQRRLADRFGVSQQAVSKIVATGAA